MVAMVAGAAAVAAVLASTYEHSVLPASVIPGVEIYGEPVGELEIGRAGARARALGQIRLERELTLFAPDLSTMTSARELGAELDLSQVEPDLRELGRGGSFTENLLARSDARRGRIDLRFGLQFSEAQALRVLTGLIPVVDRAPRPGRLDLDEREVLPPQAGIALLPQESLSRVAVGLAGDAQRIALATVKTYAETTAREREIEGLVVSSLLGEFSTPYNQEARYGDRTHNLKLGVAAIDGLVLQPGETFSFNETVGERSAEAGFRYAPGINGGELVDVLGGGICQVASSLFGAGFFSGLELVSARPHSRPSGYVDMGLDATVVWPSVDLKLRNPHDFPVVLHMSVNQGQVRAEVLGPRRPYQVMFERELMETRDFERIERIDPDLRTGTRRVSQRGMRGFKLKRRRQLMTAGEVVKEEEWTLRYPPTREIVYLGNNPRGRIPEARTFPALRDPSRALRKVQ